MHLSVPAVLRRIEASSLDHGVAYPWWMPVLCKSGQLIATVAAFLQRHQLASWQFLAVVALLAAPIVIELRVDNWLPSWVRFIPNALAIALVLSVPVAGRSIDAAAIVLSLIVADFAARDGARTGMIVALLALAAVPQFSSVTETATLIASLLIVAIGLEGGFMVHWSARALFAERQARAEAYERATLAERDRIAREIHDLVAHSLSVTMLQVTAARQILNDLPDPTGEVGEAVDALADAERVGRQAMADIRQTVSGLSATSARQPLPTIDDLGALVDQFRTAGQAVDFHAAGDLSHLPAPVGLGLYRIVQESLANVVKHGDGGKAVVDLEVTCRQARLTVRNAAPGARVPVDGLGTGLAGMKARIEQLGGHLTAGRGGEAWIVQAVVPLRSKPAGGRGTPAGTLEPASGTSRAQAT
ncbi:MAG: sensor histidine kinase [Aeromicrobium sp.]